MKATLIIFIAALCSFQSIAQGPQDRHGGRGGGGNNQGRADRVHAAKMAYITDRLELTAEQAAQFVPLYTAYENEMRDIRQTFMKKYKDDGAPDGDIASRQYIDDDLDYQQQMVDLKRKYNDRFLKVISASQLAELYVAERDFKRILIQRLQNGGRNDRGGGDRRPMRR